MTAWAALPTSSLAMVVSSTFSQVSENGFSIIRNKNPYTEEELTEAGLPLELTKQDILNIIYVRYQLFTTQYRKYLPVTIARAISDESVAKIETFNDVLCLVQEGHIECL